MSESMNDYLDELEKSYSMMGDGVHDTDELLAWEKAKELLESKEAITLTAIDTTKGGLVVEFEGIRGFIPISRLSLEHIDDVKPFINQDITVQVIEVDMDEDKLVFSARELLKEKAEDIKKQKLQEISVGMVMDGTVDSIKDYGAFVSLEGGLSGLVHISQISHNRIKHPGVVLKEGQEVKVKVIDIKDGKISLSIKALIDDAIEAEEKELEEIEIPESESIGTSMADLLSGFKFD